MRLFVCVAVRVRVHVHVRVRVHVHVHVRVRVRVCVCVRVFVCVCVCTCVCVYMTGCIYKCNLYQQEDYDDMMTSNTAASEDKDVEDDPAYLLMLVSLFLYLTSTRAHRALSLFWSLSPPRCLPPPLSLLRSLSFFLAHCHFRSLSLLVSVSRARTFSFLALSLSFFPPPSLSLLKEISHVVVCVFPSLPPPPSLPPALPLNVSLSDSQRFCLWWYDDRLGNRQGNTAYVDVT